MDIEQNGRPIPNYSADQLFSLQSGRRMGIKNPDYSGRWNWGAFFFSWLWLANHGKRNEAVLFFVLDCLPFVGFVAHLYCGFYGSNIAFDGRRFESIAHYEAVQNAWRNWSIAPLLAIVLVVGALANAHQHQVATRMSAVQQIWTIYATRQFGTSHLFAQARRWVRSRRVVDHRERVTAGSPAAQHERHLDRARVASVETAPRPTRAPMIRQAGMPAQAAMPTQAGMPNHAGMPVQLPPPPGFALPMQATMPAQAAMPTQAEPHRAGVTTVSGGACISALRSVHQATSAPSLREKLAASIATIRIVSGCEDKSTALQLRALASAERAMAEYGLGLSDWRIDIEAAIDLHSDCALDSVNIGSAPRAHCRQLANQENRLLNLWQKQAAAASALP